MKEQDRHSQFEQKERPPGKSHLFTFLFVVVLVLVVFGVFTLLQRHSHYLTLANETEAMAIPTVSVTHPIAEVPQEDIVLPGSLQAYVESPIYARTSGYLKKWYRDIGSRVRQGEILADIDTPEVDQQLLQARADLNTSQANENLSQITTTRFAELLKTDGVSKQEADNANGDFQAKRAMVQSAQANVGRLEQLESFKHVYAPFSGVITKRNVDIGNLINAGNGGATQLLFTLAQTDPIRVYVSVPEAYAPAIRAGLDAYLELAQYPGQKFAGKVVRTSEAIDTVSRTLLTEVDVPNKNGTLLPGGYAQVHLKVNVANARLQVPVNALLFRSEGLRAATVDANHKIHLRVLSIGRDYGTTLEVLNGLDASDWIVINPADSLDEGQDVHVKEMPQQAVPGAAGGGTPGAHQPASDDKKEAGAKKQ
ncbi:MAG TPA: efflux RND transporter periplasmic adaptor subunit [Candidatus Saccharimonadales bacterium]|nr:efflux RND transporter periplasmic adaptor subunit [Candidatus Saccharimonadales bacterium]